MYLIGHRGTTNNFDIIENTLDAFKYALEYHYPYPGIELDVYLNNENHLMVFHDKNLKRLFNLNIKIQNVPTQNDFGIPTLYQVLIQINPYISRTTLVNIELKGNGVAKSTYKIIKYFINKGIYNPSNFLVTSFKQIELKSFIKYNYLKIRVGTIIPEDMIPKYLPRYQIFGNFVVMDYKFKKYIRYFYDHGYDVFIYGTDNIPCYYFPYLYGLIVDDVSKYHKIKF